MNVADATKRVHEEVIEHMVRYPGVQAVEFPIRTMKGIEKMAVLTPEGHAYFIQLKEFHEGMKRLTK